MTDETLVDTAAAPATPAPTETVTDTPPITPEPKQFAIPDAYKDKAWVSKVKTEEDLWKQLDNTQALIGKKTVAPDFATATPAEIEDYFKQTRPQEKSAYKFNETTPEEIRNEYGELLYKNGISEYQGNEIIKQFDEIQKKQIEAATNPDLFVKQIKEKLGADHEVSAVEAKALITQYLGKEGMESVHASLTNDALSAMYQLALNMKKAYGAKEGDSAVNKTKTVVDTESRITEIFSELVKLPRNDLDGREKLNKELRTLRGLK